ncbi:hypothetical protein NLI96_g2848 [Meripilus lineatus]|uniref:Uncharacterized protein n=1 Tax=Meripilus lineatus TaxID=2056292 RepID=A0AAD5YH59_9APHY|nr:hypothetical protein NLI96_g2848 [Physisporinus lineatus]
MTSESKPAAPVAPYVISDWERVNYYNGISTGPPELFYRSDLLENPFPPKGTPHPYQVRPRSLQHAAQCRLGYFRFVTEDEDGNTTRGPVVIWISIYPNSATTKDAHDASLDILAILKDNGVEDVVVEWIEAVVERL